MNNLSKLNEHFSHHMRGPHRSLRLGVDHSLPRAEIFEPALSEFQTQARTNLDRHRLIDKLRCCESADSVINFPQEQAKGFINLEATMARS